MTKSLRKKKNQKHNSYGKEEENKQPQLKEEDGKEIYKECDCGGQQVEKKRN